MYELKQIRYGVADFAQMRAKKGYFVDRTDLPGTAAGSLSVAAGWGRPALSNQHVLLLEQ